MRLHFLLGMLLIAVPAAAQAPPAKPGTDTVPSTAFGFVSVRLSDLRDVEAFKPIREAIARIEKAEGVRFEKHLGVPLDDIDRITFFWPSAPTGGYTMAPYIVYSTRTPYNEAKVLKSLEAIPARDALENGHFFGGKGALPPELRTRPEFAPPSKTRLVTPPDVAAPRKFPPPPPPSKDELPPLPKGFGDTAQVADPPPKVDRVDPPAEASEGRGPELYFRRDQYPYPVIYLLDEQTILLMPTPHHNSSGLLTFLGQTLRRKNDGPLADALAEANKHTFVAAVRMQPLEEFLRADEKIIRELTPYRSLFKAQTAMFTANLAQKTTLNARLTFADAASARRAEPVLKTLLQNGVDAIGELKKDQSKGAEWNAVMNPLLDLAATALDKADVKSDGRILTARVEAEIGPAISKAIAALPNLIEAAATRQKTLNNLKQIGLAIHYYHDSYGHFPTNITSPDGKVLLSWRVAILPFIEQDNLFRRLDMTKAWDDPANAKLLETMPDVFRVYGRDADKGKTYLQMPFSPQAPATTSPILVTGRKLRMSDIADGTSNTLMVLEAADAVNWAKPDDILFDPTKAMKLGDQSRKWFYVLMGDGAVRTMRRDKLTDREINALITINGGEVFDFKD